MYSQLLYHTQTIENSFQRPYDFIPETHVPPDLEEFNDILCSQIDTRVSCDKVSNK